MPLVRMPLSWSLPECSGLTQTQICNLHQPLQTALSPFPERPLLLGLSGGMDSVLLLHCLAADPQWASRLNAVHINHQLMPEADNWQQACQRWCDAVNIPLIIRKVTVVDAGEGTEAAARRARYDAFERLLPEDGLLLLAHHADDQAETLLLRLLRGSGLKGLSAMPAQRRLSGNFSDQRQLLRPWLGLSRSELEGAARAMSLQWVDDPSNTDTAYDRNWLRHEVMPGLTERVPGLSQRLAATAGRLQQDQHLLEALLSEKLDPLLQPCDWPCTLPWSLDLDALESLGQAYHHHALTLWLSRLGLPAPQGDKLPHWLEQCLTAAPDRSPATPYAGYTLQRHGSSVFAWQAPAESAADVLSHSVSADLLGVTVPWWGGVIDCPGPFSASLAGCDFRAASDLPGLKIAWPGRPSRTVRQIWQEYHIPLWLRPHWPVLCHNDEVLAVAGLTPVTEKGDTLGSADALQWRRG